MVRFKKGGFHFPVTLVIQIICLAESPVAQWKEAKSDSVDKQGSVACTTFQ